MEIYIKGVYLKMPKLDKSIYRGFLNTLEKARSNNFLVTLYFFREPTLRGYVDEIDVEVYVATITSEEGNCSQVRLSQITRITWEKNGYDKIDLTPKGLNQKDRKKAIKVEEIERDKLEEKSRVQKDIDKHEGYKKEKEEKKEND